MNACLLPVLAIACAAAAQDPVRAQDVSAQGLPAQSPAENGLPENGLPGRRPGTERWIVRLRGRSFDLAAYRAAMRGGPAPARVDDVVADLDQLARRDQAEFVAFAEGLGAEVTDQWWLVNGLAVEIEPGDLPALRRHPRVESVQPDFARRPGELIRTATNRNNHATDEMHARGFDGRGTTIAIVDSGLDVDMAGAGRPHATFYVNGDVNDRSGGGRNGSRILGNFRIGQQPADDPIAHGTSVAGVAAGERWNASAAADRGHAPAAKLVGYAVADLPNGFASVTTLTNAWQRIATDAARFSIGVANCSYEGFATPQAMDQVAIDALAQAADIVIVGMAGNGGPSSLYGYGALNMLAVGAVENDNRRVAAFSSRGPLPGDPQRFYPDLVANGVDIIMPAADNEAGQRMAQGTSYSSPQVAGAAALYRSARPAASATEVKAAILATAENVSAQNPNPPYNSRNAYGHGYLRTDNLVFAALYGAHRDGVVTPTEPAARLTLPVTAGHEYAVGLAWFKQSSSSRNWSDLNLEIRDSNLIVLASSSTPRNTAEVVHFVAPTSGSVFAYVRAVGFENGQTAQPFSAVLADRTDTDGSLSSYGSSCDLSRLDPGDDPPSIGLSYSVEYRGRALTTAALLTGASDQVWLGRQLPFDLAPFGAPGCFVLTSTNVVLGIPVSSEGTGIVHLSVPFERSLIGVAVFHQALTFDPPRNPLGVVLSNGLRAVIGN